MANHPTPDNTADREIVITRLLNAPRALVFKVWTDPEHIVHWWGPNGFTNTNHEMDVKPGGKWRFTMHGPDGTNFPNLIQFQEVIPPVKLVYLHGSENADDPGSFHVTITFEEKGNKTELTMKSVFRSKEDRDFVVEKFGAIEGGKQTLTRLEAYLAAQLNIRQQLKTNTMARVSTYLNFPGNTEEAFNFYKSIFGGDFSGKGIQRFGSLPPMEGAPPISDTDKNLILHIELTILGGHVLMATDAPESMGFTVKPGNNVYINLEPDTKKETKRLFDALSAGGTVTMELQDMFWGAYYGSCTDKYGISWMFNCEAQP